ncbi:11513_t:CDS:2 [Entrophospora sp. SA101]|nr:11513_t:CDS:2 [Entrophospora sp. SA101]
MIFPNKIRTIEDLKERYYSVCKKILQIKPSQPGNNQQDKGAIIALNTYDKSKGRKKKKKFTSFQKRKKSFHNGPLTPIVEFNGSSRAFNLSARDLLKRQQQNQHYRTSTSTTTVSEPHSKVEAIIPIHTRCEKFPIRASVRRYLPTVPTESVCGKWTELQKAIQNLLDLKKNLEKQENELKTKQVTLQKAKSSIIDSSNVNNSLTNGSKSPRRYLPTVPTESVCGKWTELQKAIQNLLDLKKNLEKQENELKTKQVTLQKAKSSIIDSSNVNNSLTNGSKSPRSNKKLRN